ncbi:MAG: hypothetical protein ACYDAG_17900, partial [Chloroflexota bacterium]
MGSRPPLFPGLTEAEVNAGFEQLVRLAPGLVVVNLYPMNRERVAAFGRSCRRHGRAFLMERQAALIGGWPDILHDVAAAASRPREHCVQLGFESPRLLIDLSPPPGSFYVHCDGAPLGTYDPRWPVMEAWARVMGLSFVLLGSSGHSSPADIARMVERVGPGVVLPVHSRAPEALEAPGVPSLIPEVMRRYTAAERKVGVLSRGQGTTRVSGQAPT